MPGCRKSRELKVNALHFLMQKIVLLKENHLEMPIKRERIMKHLVICSVNELQLMVHVSVKNVQLLAFCLKHSLTKRGAGGSG